MGVLGATLIGLGRSFGSSRILLFLWLLNLLVALPAAIAIGGALSSSLGQSLADDAVFGAIAQRWLKIRGASPLRGKRCSAPWTTESKSIKPCSGKNESI